MKKLSYMVLMLCFLTTTIHAQERRQERNGRIEAMRVAFITEELKLTVEEAQSFWPIFNEYEAERKKIKKSFDYRRDIEDMTDAEADTFISQSFVRDQQMLDLKLAYYEKFKTAIPIRKIAQLSRVEKNFRQELLKRMKRGREGHHRG